MVQLRVGGLVAMLLALPASEALRGQADAPARAGLRGRVLQLDGTAWTGATVLLASTLFPNASGAGIQDNVVVESDARGYFEAALLTDRTYAAWAVQLEAGRPDKVAAYRVSHVATAGVGRTVRLVESTLRCVRVPCMMPADAPAGSRLLAEGLIHPPGQAEAINVALAFEADDEARHWTPLWPYGVVPVRVVAPDGTSLGASSVAVNAVNVEHLRQPDGSVDLARLGRVTLHEGRKAPDTFAVRGRILAAGRPVAAIVNVRDIAVGFRERVVRSDANGAFQLAGVKAPVEVWCRRAEDGVPELSLVGCASGPDEADLGEVDLTKLRCTEIRIVGADGMRAERAVIAIETFRPSLAVLRSFAGRRGSVRIRRPNDAELSVAARWTGGFATGPVPAAAEAELRGLEPVTISGRVLDPQRAAQPHTEVGFSLDPSAGVPGELSNRFSFLVPGRVWTDENGQFRLELPAASWSYAISASRFAPGRIETARVVIPDARHPGPIELCFQ